MAGLSDDQIGKIGIVERVSSSISLICVLFVLLTYLFSPSFNKPINRQIFYATWSNLGLCIAGLIGVDGYLGGTGMPLCKFQAFLVQIFLGVDAYWALCMAINVYLAFFSGRTVEQLRALDVWYLGICYGASFVPAIVFIFVTTDRGPIYGDASIWCWVSSKWDFLRLACVYAIVWAALLLSLLVYIKAGRVIYRRRNELDGFLNPWNENPFANEVVTEIRVTHEDRRKSSGFLEEGVPAGLEGAERDESGDQQYSVNVEAPPQQRSNPITDVLNVRNVTRDVAARHDNAEAWLYARVAFLFFFALAITWIPSSVNRVYGIFHPDDPSFGLSMAGAVLLPLQGFWNAIVYIITSRTAFARLAGPIFGRPPPLISDVKRSKAIESGEQSLIRNPGHGGGVRSVGSLSSITPSLKRGRIRGGREFMDGVMMGNIGRERLNSQDGGSRLG